MTKIAGGQGNDIRGACRMLVDAVIGITGVVQAIHTRIAEKPLSLAGATVGGAVTAITSVAYDSIRGVTRAVGAGVDLALAAAAPALDQADSSQAREAVISIVNGVLGDYLVATGNPLAITMQLRREGEALDLMRHRLADAIEAPSPRVLVLVHGLCRGDRGWERQGHDHGAKLARELSYTNVYLRYNTGMPVWANGRALAHMLEDLVSEWPVPLEELSILAHSMGGLVARSAFHYASAAGHIWPGKLRKLVFLGTPHHGAPLERAGHGIDLLLEKTPYCAPLAALGKVRSAGITDLRYGCVLEEQWRGCDHSLNRAAARSTPPLPTGVQCYAIAAALGRVPMTHRDRLIGDGLVPVPSALGQHRDARLRLAFPRGHQWIARGTGHLGLLEAGPVYERIRAWLDR